MATRRGKPRLGFLGVGWIGRHRLERVLEAGVAEVTAVADSSAELALVAAEAAGGAYCLGSLDELLTLDLDGLVVATPSALHAEQAITALSRGLAVFCQKPLGRDAEETRRAVEAARRNDRLLGVDFSYRHVEGMRRLRNLIRNGELGRIFAVNLVFHNAYGPDKPWFYERSLSGGGCLVDLGIHLVDLALWALDFPEVVEVHGRCFSKGKPLSTLSDAVEDYVVARLELASGAVIDLSCSWHVSAGCDAVIGAQFFGSNGGAELKNVNGSFFDFEAFHYRGTAREQLAAPPDEWGGRAAVAWAQQLAQGNRFDPQIERAVAVAAVLDAVYASGTVATPRPLRVTG
ncbi:MAG TPA: Gfo/Idh/MocA family oxidoreductase [Gammaproteobacteria bacterium]|nr:Gfo/Idh/MocA family oxidoreductase [Gammaproteobacteria bacterium]